MLGGWHRGSCAASWMPRGQVRVRSMVATAVVSALMLRSENAHIDACVSRKLKPSTLMDAAFARLYTILLHFACCLHPCRLAQYTLVVYCVVVKLSYGLSMWLWAGGSGTPETERLRMQLVEAEQRAATGEAGMRESVASLAGLRAQLEAHKRGESLWREKYDALMSRWAV